MALRTINTMSNDGGGQSFMANGILSANDIKVPIKTGGTTGTTAADTTNSALPVNTIGAVTRAPGLSAVDNVTGNPNGTVYDQVMNGRQGVVTQPSVPETQTELPATSNGGNVNAGGVAGGVALPDAGTVESTTGDGNTAFEGIVLPSYTDYSDYLNELYANQQAATLAALESTYMQQLAALDAQAAKVPEYYYEAGRQVTGQNAREQQAMNERFNAMGLNTGAAGQAALAQNAVYQGNTAAIKQAEAEALADIEAERASLTIQYQNEIKQAILDNETEKAAALYEEMLRLDNGIVQNALAQAELDMQAYEYNLEAENREREQLEERAAAMAALGDYSLYKYLGYTDEQIAALTSAYGAKNTGGGGGGGVVGTLTFSRAKELADNGYIDADVAAVLMKNGYSTAALEAMYGYTAGGTTVVPTTTPGTMGVIAGQLYGAITKGGMTAENIANVIESELAMGRITQAEADALITAAGF